VPECKAEDVKELFSSLFGGEVGNVPVLEESRDITRLGTAVGSEQGVATLRNTRNPEAAYEAAGGPLDRMKRRRLRVHSILLNAQDDMLGYENDEDVVRLLSQCQAALEKLMGPDDED
jgi:hypothetical protein